MAVYIILGTISEIGKYSRWLITQNLFYEISIKCNPIHYNKHKKHVPWELPNDDVFSYFFLSRSKNTFFTLQINKKCSKKNKTRSDNKV